MDKKLVVTYFVAVLVLGAGAFAAMRWLKSPKAAEKIIESAPDPLFYKSMSTAERLVAARYRLDSMTRNDIPADQIGPIKDEVALLAEDEAVVDLIVERYRACKDANTAQLSAYMEIFARIRHKKFAELVIDGITDPRETVQANAIDAAIVQRDPRLVSHLSRFLTTQSGYSAEKILQALAAIGTTDALAACIRAIESPDPRTKIWAMTGAAGARWSECIPTILEQCNHADPMVRTIAAFALARLGDPRGKLKLLAAANDGAATENARAQAVQNILQVGAKDLAPELKKMTDSEIAGVRREARVALAAWRDPDLLKRLESDLRGEDPMKRADAITILARSGVDDDARLLATTIDALAPDEAAAVLQQLPQGAAPAALEIYARYVKRPDDLAVVALRYIHRFGPKALDILLPLAKETIDEERLTFIIAAISSVGTREAADLLMPFIHHPSRRVAHWTRQNIRLVEQELLKR